MNLLQIYQWVCQWKNLENRLTFGEVMGKSLVSCFLLRHSVYHKFLWIIVQKRLRWHLFMFTCNVYIYFCFRPFIYSELNVRWTAVMSVLVLWAVACCVYEVSISACPCLCVSGISEPTRQRSQEAAGSMCPRPSQPQVLRLRHAAGDRASD